MKAKLPHISISTPTASRAALALAIATVVLTILRALALHFSYTPALGYFATPLISSLLYITPILLCVAGAALAFWRSPALPRKKEEKKTPEQKRAAKKAAKEEKAHLAKLKRAGIKLPPEPLPTLVPPFSRERTTLTRAADWLCAAAFLAAALIDSDLIPLPRLRVIFALIGAFAYIFPTNGHKLSPIARIAHLAPCAYCIVCIAIDYFDWNAPMNGPIKISTQLTLCIVILYLNSNARLAIADHILRRRNVCAALAAVAGVSMGIANLCALPTGAILATTVSPMLICSAVGIHAAVSLAPTFLEEVPTLIVPPKRPLPSLPDDSKKNAPEERQDLA